VPADESRQHFRRHRAAEGQEKEEAEADLGNQDAGSSVAYDSYRQVR